VETKVTIGDGAEFELGKKQCCITCENHLIAQDKINSKQTNFYLCHMKTIQKQMRQLYIFLSNMVNMIRKKGMHFICVSYVFLMRFFFFQEIT